MDKREKQSLGLVLVGAGLSTFMYFLHIPPRYCVLPLTVAFMCVGLWLVRDNA